MLANSSGLAVETAEEGRARLENDAATKRLSLVMETDEERKPKLEKMVATAQVMLGGMSKLFLEKLASL